MKQGGSTVATIVPESGPSLDFAVVDAPPVQAEVDEKLDVAREQLMTLRRQQEELERQKGELEELRRKQEEYARGRREMSEHLTRGLITLEREQVEAQRLAELCGRTSDAFRSYLDQLQAVNDQEWTSDTVRGELTKALAIIENSRLEFNRARTKLDCLNPRAGEPVADADGKPAIDWTEMRRYLRLGAAASAPLIAAGTLWLIIALVAHLIH